jgi:hypothetical protein
LKLWRIIRIQAALTLFVAAVMTQLAQARPAPSQETGDAVGARWNAVADSYGARPAASYYIKRALDAMGQRMQAQVPVDPGALFPNGDPSSPGYVPGAERYEALRTDLPSTSSEPGPTTTGYVVGGDLVQPGESAGAAKSAIRPDDRAGIRSVDGIAVSTANGAIWGMIPKVVVANEASGMQARHGAHSQNDAVHTARPDGRAGFHGVEAPQMVATNIDRRFDWGDAGIGAIGAFGSSVLLAGCAFLALSHGRRKPASP